MPPPILRCLETWLASCCLKKIRVCTDRSTYSPLIRHGPYRKRLQQASSILWGGNVCIEPLPSNYRNIQTHRLMGGFIKCVVEMGSGAMIYIPGFRRTGSGIQNWCGGYTDTQTKIWSHKPTFIFSKWGKWLKIHCYSNSAPHKHTETFHIA
jgi:hypothetical protein